MDWSPAVSVKVDGKDMTAVFQERLVSVLLVDTAGVQSDTVDLVLSDNLALARLELPPTGAEIEVALGYGFSAQVVGLYIAEEIGASGPPDRVTIKGYASPYGESAGGKSPLNDAKTRSWAEGTKLSAIVAKIARESGLTSAVSAEAGKVVPGHLDQIDESDMSLLTRIARENGLTFKPGGGRLILVKSGESATASGAALPKVELARTDITRWSLSVRRPEAVKRVVTKYRDLATSKTVEVEVDTPATTSKGGSSYGDEILARVRSTKKVVTPYANKASAEAGAKAAADEARRKSQQVRLDLPGRADLMAEGRLILSGLRPGIDREWLIRQVTHQMDDGGWRTSVECELPPG